MVLPDGRRLAYSEYGAPDGTPCFYCHGFPSSRREALLIHSAAEAAGVRLISPDRPGYGDSDPLPDRTLPAWSADLLALADHLEVERLNLIGMSGGGPYALACAYRVPERVRTCTLIGALGPIYLKDVLLAMHAGTRASLSLARAMPGISELVWGSPLPRLFSAWPDAMAGLRSMYAGRSDRETLQDQQVRRVLDCTVKDAMDADARGARQDLLLYTHPWGIELEAVEPTIDLWHGEADETVPVAHGHWYAQHLPRCRARILEQEGHYSLPIRHAATILGTILEPA